MQLQTLMDWKKIVLLRHWILFPLTSVGTGMDLGFAISIKKNQKSNRQFPVIRRFEREQMEEE